MSESFVPAEPRGRHTPRSVRTVERIARVFISAGGVGTILAVTLICVFLVWVAIPLGESADLEVRGEFTPPVRAEPLASGFDEFRTMAWTLARDGRVLVTRAEDGQPMDEQRLFAGNALPTAASFPPGGGHEAAFGFADGTIRTGSIRFDVSFPKETDVPDEVRNLAPGATARQGKALVQRLETGQLRAEKLAAELDDPVPAADGAIRLLDFSLTPAGPAYATLTEDGRLAVHTESVKENMLTGEKVRKLSSVQLPYAPPPGRGLPAHLVLSGVATQVFVLWADGFVLRYDVSDRMKPVLAETENFVEPGVKVTAVTPLVGKSTFVIGDSRGRARAWFLTKPADAGTLDGAVLSLAHEMEGPAAPVTALAPSSRSRVLAAGYASGDVRIFLVTSASLLAEAQAGDDPVDILALAPKLDVLLAGGADGLYVFDFDPKYPEGSPAELFGKVWYEGYEKPQYVWQSTGGSDDFEPKLGLVPLIFGTLKATFYSIVIGAPIALLAAIYTSEFMEARRRARVKAVIEMMASLPSVVLGFLAALVIAPFVETVLPATLASFATLPFCILLGARIWQLLPQRVALRLAGWPRLGAMALAILVGVLLAMAAGPPLERLLFEGDLRAWLADKNFGGAVGGWIILLLPLGAIAAVVLSAFVLGPFLRHVSASWTPLECAGADLARYVAAVLFAVAVAWAGGALLAHQGADARGTFLDTYDQKNALIVGFVMGFAIIPIIYTLAEDALSSVPMSLRAASLGSGATQWQTAWRVVIPTAMSGIFGALMVGLGRAVGETMIVLMAAGNTPILDWNPLNGFRTLSANIAVELPEAPRNGALYRTLFVAALVLFAMTFVVNTAAELVRRRFRKRFAEL